MTLSEPLLPDDGDGQRLLRSVQHSLRTPVGHLLTLSDLLLLDVEVPLPDALRPTVALLLQETEHLQALMSAVGELVTLQLTRAVLQPVDVLALAQAGIRERESGPPVVLHPLTSELAEADPALLRQALDKLLALAAGLTDAASCGLWYRLAREHVLLSLGPDRPDPPPATRDPLPLALLGAPSNLDFLLCLRLLELQGGRCWTSSPAATYLHLSLPLPPKNVPKK